MKTLFVGLGHYSGVGKDESARILRQYLKSRAGLCVHIMSFADKVKEIAHAIWSPFGLKDKAYYEINRPARHVVIPALGKTPLEIWIEFGTAYARNMGHDDVWVEHLIQAGQSADVVIVPDVRFINEVTAIQNQGGLVFKVERRGVKPLDTVPDQSLNRFEGWDGTIGNHGDLNQLALTLNSYVDRILKHRSE